MQHVHAVPTTDPGHMRPHFMERRSTLVIGQEVGSTQLTDVARLRSPKSTTNEDSSAYSGHTVLNCQELADRETFRLFAKVSQCRILSEALNTIRQGWFETMAIDEFNDVQKKQFMDEDAEAWNSICTILLGIISVGLVLACIAVWLVAG